MSLLQKLLLGTIIIVAILFVFNIYFSYRSTGNFEQMIRNLDKRVPDNTPLYQKLEQFAVNDTVSAKIKALHTETNKMIALIDRLKDKINRISKEEGSNSTRGSTWMIENEWTGKLNKKLTSLNELGQTLTTINYKGLIPESVLKLKSKGITWDQHFEKLPHPALKALLSYLELKVKEEEQFILKYVLEHRVKRVTAI